MQRKNQRRSRNKIAFIALFALLSTPVSWAADTGLSAVVGLLKSSGTSSGAAYGVMAQHKLMPKLTTGLFYLKSSVGIQTGSALSAASTSTTSTAAAPGVDLSVDRTLIGAQGVFSLTDQGQSFGLGLRLGQIKTSLTGTVTSSTTSTLESDDSGFFAGPIAEYDIPLSDLFSAGASVGYMKGFGDSTPNQIQVFIQGRAWLF